MNILSYLFSNTDNYIIGVATGIVSSIIVTKLYNKKEIKNNTLNYLSELSRYMNDVSSAITFSASNETLFWTKLYNDPKLNGRIEYNDRIDGYIKIYRDTKSHIEIAYHNYILCQKYIAKGKIRYQKAVVDDAKKELESYAEKYKMTASKIATEDLNFYKAKANKRTSSRVFWKIRKFKK